MSCIGHHRLFSDFGEKTTMKFDKLKDKAKLATESINQTKQIEKCLLCADRQKQIEVHHPNEKNTAKAVYHIAKCKQCAPLLSAMVVCAKMGHLHE